MNWRTGIVALLFLIGGSSGQGVAATDCPVGQRNGLADLRAGDVPENRRVTVEGVVTAVFTGQDRLGGFFVQNDATPPVGLFVYAPALADSAPRAGDRVQVSGRFTRFHGRPQINRVSELQVCAHPGLPPPYLLTLPADAGQLSDLQDIKVRFPQSLTVTGNHRLGRYGSLRLSAGGRLLRRGQQGDVTEASNRARQIELDDGSYRAEPKPIPYLNTQGTRRVGDEVVGLTGILTHAFDSHRIHPTREPVFRDRNPRPAPATVAQGTVRVATLNLENYFLTLGSRGAASGAALQRQRRKLTAAVRGLNADVISMTEVENGGRALADLVAVLNHGIPARQHYRAVDHPWTGTHAIRNALLYRPTRVELLGADVDADPVHNRPPLLAWFRPTGRGEPFGIVAVHFKSKASCPAEGDIDQGQGCWNRLRSAQARRLLNWLHQVRDPGVPVLIAGDLNAYAAEDPVATLLTRGKRDLVSVRHPTANHYTYVFNGESGQLDYLVAPPALADRVVDAGIWAINADEPRFLAFDGRQPARGPWRSSDHDPVWADLKW